MNRKRIIQFGIALAILVLTGSSFYGKAQSFDEARKYAFNGEREKARSICRMILSEGFNSDVALLMGRTYAWDGKYDSARVVLENVLVEKPGNLEAYDALSDVEFWSDNNEKAIEYCNEAILSDSTAYSFVLKKARILHSAEKYDEAVDVLENYLKKNPRDPDFIIRLKEYRLDLVKNYIKVAYTLDVFNQDFNRNPWHLFALSYGRKTKLGTIIFRTNYSRIFGEQGFQYEMDAYPKISDNNYGYLNYGYSQNVLFPRNRFGAEWYHNFPNAFEGSLGVRYLDYSSSGVDIYTATFGKYIGNYWISFRTYVTPDPEGTSVSGFLSARRYFADSEDYIGLRAGYGVSPDDRRNPIETAEKLSLKTNSVRLEFNHIFKRVLILNTAIIAGNEELVPGTYSGYISFDLGISRLF